MEDTITFFNQWTKRPVVAAYEFTKPTCTVPDQSMTVSEIIARFTRAGIVPKGSSPLQAGAFINSFMPQRPDGEVAMEPDFDPMDEYTEAMEAVKASTGSEQAPQEPVSEPVPQSAPGAGNGGE